MQLAEPLLDEDDDDSPTHANPWFSEPYTLKLGKLAREHAKEAQTALMLACAQSSDPAVRSAYATWISKQQQAALFVPKRPEHG